MFAMIRKFYRRLICLFLAFLIVGALLPTGVSAQSADTREATPEEVKAQLSRMYNQILDLTQSESLGGLCATLVTWELYIKRINRQFVSGDGKDQFDNYCDMDVTSGGYYVHAYSAEDYTLEEALLKITNNGTRNAYNILIGFEKTRSAAGAQFGHTVFIGGIIDGMVYYVESNDYSVGGVFYTEGTPITCTIRQFAAEYAGWTVFDGAIAFDETNYLDECRIYPTDVYVRVNGDSELRTEPCYEEDSPWSDHVRSVGAGEVFHADALVCDSQGRYWYRAAGEEPVYFPGDNTTMVYSCYDNVAVSGVELPGILEAGCEVETAGTVTSAGSDIRMVRCQVFSGHVGEGKLLYNQVSFTDTTEYDLETLAGRLDFSSLEPGTYHYTISVVAQNSFLKDGALERRTQLKNLWTSEFAVCETLEDGAGLQSISLDANGGDGIVERLVLEEGEEFPAGAVPARSGYSFVGWFQNRDGRVRGPFLTATGAEPAYAGWSLDTEGFRGWHQVDGVWRFYEDGAAVTGLVQSEGITCYVYEDGSFHTGWLEVDGQTYYFFENGIAARGIVTLDGEEYVFGPDGAVTNAWVLN